MAAVIKIEVTQSGGIDKLKSDVESIGASAEKSGGGFSAMGEIATGALRHIGEIAVNVAGAAISKFTEVIGDSISAARESNMVAAQTAQVIKSTGAAAGVTTQHVLDYASALSAASGKSLFGDEQIAESTNLLLTFTEIKGKTLDAATAISVDMAQALGGAPKDAAIQLGKALNDPIKGITALTRVGVSFSAEQKATIQAMQEAGDTAGAQAIILAELNKEFGGSAAAAAAADGGFAQFHDRLGEMEETIGKAILPVLGQLMGVLNDTLLPIVENLANKVGPFIEDLTQGFSEGGLGGAINTFLNELFGLNTNIGFLVDDKLTALKSLIDDIAQGFSEGGLGGAINTFLNEVFALNTNVGFFVDDVLQHLIATFTDAPTPVEGFLNVLGEISPTFAFVRAAVEAALPPIQSIIQSVFDIIQGVISGHGATMLADVQSVWAQIQGLINAVLPPIQSIIASVFGAIATFLHTHGADIQAFIKTTWDQIAAIVKVAVALVQAIIVPVFTFVAGFIRDHGTQIQALLSAAWTAIKAVIDAALTIIKGVLTAALQIIQGNWSGAWETIKGTFARVWEDIKVLLSADLDALKAMFSGTVDSLTRIGSDLINGLLRGIKDGWDRVERYISDAADQLPDWFKAAYGISSPSKVMAEEVGAPIIAGVMAGMQDTLPGLINLIDDLGTQVVEANKKWKPNIVNAFRDTINGIDDEIQKLGDSISNTINDAFLGAASLDRAKARAIDTLKDIGVAQQQNVQAQLAGADEVASKMSDPAAAAKYFKMRSDQIFELAKLQSQLVEGTDPATKAAQLAALQAQMNAQLGNRANLTGRETAGIHALFDPQIQAIQDKVALTANDVIANQRIQDQIALITDAQKNELAGAAKASVSPASALIMQLSDLKMKADDVLRQGGSQFVLPAEYDGNPVINALRALTNQLSMLTSGGNSSTVTSSNSVFNYAPTITTSAAVTPAPAATMRALANV